MPTVSTDQGYLARSTLGDVAKGKLRKPFELTVRMTVRVQLSACVYGGSL